MSEFPVSGLARLIYASRATLEGRDLNDEVRRILIASMSRNRQVDVTGLLLRHAGWFMQVLEGPAPGVRDTYSRVSKDRRHTDLRLIEVGPAEMRLFRDWNMCERRLTASETPFLSLIGQGLEFRPDQISAENALALLTMAGRVHIAG
jgi:hypothetical protein